MDAKKRMNVLNQVTLGIISRPMLKKFAVRPNVLINAKLMGIERTKCAKNPRLSNLVR
jgi:hypothetical protein